MPKSLTQALRAGIRFLAEQQQPDGSFLNFAGPYTNLETVLPVPNTSAQHSVFATALIGLFLRDLPTSVPLKTLQHQLAQFLLKQRGPLWTWNYWNRTAAESSQYPYPDDLDVTSCSLAALFHLQPQLFTGDVLASIVQMLTQLEVQEGGPYFTWVVPATALAIWRDVDLAVNANIAYFLSLLDVHLEPLQEYLSRGIQARSFTTPYYPSVYPVIYFLSRTCSTADKQILKNTLLKLQNSAGTWGTPLNTALSICTLLEIEPTLSATSLKSAAQSLIATQHADGSWPGHVFYTGVKSPTDQQPYGAGSPYLTTAVCLRALDALEKHKLRAAPHKAQVIHLLSIPQQQLLKEIRQHLTQAVQKLPRELKIVGKRLVEHTLLQDESSAHQISLLPLFFHQAAGKKLTPKTKKLLVQLGAANVYGWIAYTIYDDFLDDEGKPERLSFAHWCQRELTRIYLQLELRNATSFQQVFHNIMATIDEANTWEVRHCRVSSANLLLSGEEPAILLKDFVVPDFGRRAQLADRSIGHALGPLALLYSWGYTEHSAAFTSTLQFFHHYLITRQLNDDAHDWETDLRRGQVNYAGSVLLDEYKAKHPTQATKNPLSFAALGKVFWHSTILHITQHIHAHTRTARKALKKNPVLKDVTFFEDLLTPLKQSAHLAETERLKALDFLAKYV